MWGVYDYTGKVKYLINFGKIVEKLCPLFGKNFGDIAKKNFEVTAEHCGVIKLNVFRIIVEKFIQMQFLKKIRNNFKELVETFRRT